MITPKCCFYCGQAIADTPVRRPAVRRPDGTVLYYAYQHLTAPACCSPAAGVPLRCGQQDGPKRAIQTSLGG